MMKVKFCIYVSKNYIGQSKNPNGYQLIVLYWLCHTLIKYKDYYNIIIIRKIVLFMFPKTEILGWGNSHDDANQLVLK